MTERKIFLRFLFFIAIFFINSGRVFASPNIFDISPTSGSRINGFTSLTFSTTELNDVGCQIDGLNWGRPCGASNFTSIPGWGNVEEGTVTLLISGTDQEGNSFSTTTTYLKDTLLPIINLIGSSEESVVVGTTYTDPGVTASNEFGVDLTADVVVGGDIVDINTLGDYTITYNVADSLGDQALEVRRIVHIIPFAVTGLSDDFIPTKNKTWSWSANKADSTFRFSLDQDVSGVIDGEYSSLTGTSTENLADGTYYLHVQAKDLSDNESLVTTVSVVIDNTPPVIDVLGSNPLNLVVGESFTDPGATSTDSIDGSVITTSAGSVDSNTAGTYTITYSATDRAGNDASGSRTIVVSPAPSRSGGGGGGGSSRVSTSQVNVAPTSPVSSGIVLGASTFRFLKDLSFGMKNNDVNELQLRLIKEGYLKSLNTGYFGSQTLLAVKTYQKRHQLPASGFFGPMTRAMINGDNQTELDQTKINALLEQLKYFQTLLDKIKNK